MSRTQIRFLASMALAASATLVPIRQARATPVEIVVVMWQQDLSVRTEVEQFFGCLVNSSSSGTTWAQQFGLTQVTFRGVYVLADPCPQQAHLAGNLHTLLTAAFDANTLPLPSPGGTSYLLYLPAGVQGYDESEIPACQGTYCGVHGTTSYRGMYYDAALVPIDCPDCGSVQATLIGEHEAAEAIANFGTAQYEVGDSCEGPSHETQLACCGTQYPIQQLSSNRSDTDCQTINATGNMCGCASARMTCTMASDCCPGLSCGAVVEQPTGMVCCAAAGGMCATRADCCGGLQCSANRCACADDGQRCVTDGDCCMGRCDPTSKMCGRPPMPDAGTGNPDAPSGSGGSGGGSGGSGGAGGNGIGNGGDVGGGCSIDPIGAPGGVLLLLALVALARKRTRR